VRKAAISRAIGVLLLGAGAFVPACQAPGHDPGPPIPVDQAAIYAQMCARCHGLDGRGDPEMKKTMPVRDFSDPKFQAEADSAAIGRVIMAGRNQMPAFGAMLSAPKIQALAGYVRRLGQSPAAGQPAPQAPAAAKP
jgi:mono/diheme cytochrome c family protein